MNPKRISDIFADWNHPTEIRFGVGRIGEVADACRKLMVSRPLVISDAGVAGLPFVKKMIEDTREGGLATGLFDGVALDPDTACVAAGVDAYRSGEYNGIIAVGGGSALDAGKAIALGVRTGVDNIWKYSFAGPEQSGRRLGGVPPIVAIPTTSGTGSEVGFYAVITDADNRKKSSVFHPELLPAVVIADPELTRRLPPAVTANTGMDAFSHNLEALCSPAFNPMLDGVALLGIRYLKDWLPQAVREGRRLMPRVYTMAASIMGAIAFEKGLGAMHAMAHAVGAVVKSHHGRTVAALMPFVLRANQNGIQDKIRALAHYLELPEASFEAFLNWLRGFSAELGMPASLAELGVEPDLIPELVEKTLTDGNLQTNPVALDGPKLEKLYHKCLNKKCRKKTAGPG